MPSPEDQARENIDHLLSKKPAERCAIKTTRTVWRTAASRSKITLKPGHSFADYLFYVDGRAAGAIAEFHNGYLPGIAVTVHMIATGTDIKPLEVVLFMRSVKSRASSSR